jgi:hypothetical protein
MRGDLVRRPLLVVIGGGRRSAAEAGGLLREAIRLRPACGYRVAGVLHRLRRHMRPQLPVAAGDCGLARAIDRLTRAEPGADAHDSACAALQLRAATLPAGSHDVAEARRLVAELRP